MEQYSIVGKRVPRVDGVSKVTGNETYLGDVKLPGLLHAKILRSPYPHARIINIDVSKAEKLPGVKAVITGSNIPPIKMGYRGGPYGADRTVLATDRVRYVGDEVAAVAATDVTTAEEALELIKVEYEELPAIFDPEEAMKPGAVKIHDHVENNILIHMYQDYGDVERAFKDADYVFEDRFTTPAVSHCCMEPRGWIAHFDATGKLTIWSSAQSPASQKIYLANLFNMPANAVRFINTSIGGGFGSKSTFGQAPIVTILSKMAGRPVKIQFTREDEFTVAGHRYPAVTRIKTAVRKDGKLLGWHLTGILDNGAYYAAGNIVLGNLGRQAFILYGLPNVRFEGFAVYTNNPWGTGFRGLGRPQSVFALESQMDMIAERLGLDPVDLRLKNANQPNTVTCDGRHITTCGMTECIEKAVKASRWKEKRGQNKNRGIGIACMGSACGGIKLPPYYVNYAESIATIDEKGMVTLLVPEPDVAGSKTVITQIAAEELGVRVEDVRIATGDTDLVPLASWGSGASRVTFTAGNAAKLAAADAKRQIFEAAAELLEANPDDLEARDRIIYVKGSPTKSVSIADAVGASYKKTGKPITGKGQFDDPYSIPANADGSGGTSPTHTFAAQIAEVEVDTRTGQVEILKFVAAHDVGFAINPMGVEGQFEGSVATGVGFALTEEIERDTGRTLNANFMDYHIPTTLDTPSIQPIAVETMEMRGPFGAKGIAEPGLVPTAPAVANAIYNAIGIRFKDLPITPMKIRRALREKERAEK